MKTFIPNPAGVEKKWYVVDAAGQTLGRLATAVANILRGKNKPEYTPFMDMGDYVIVINAKEIKVTGKKFDKKNYYRHTGYIGGLKETTLRQMLDTKPEEVILHAVKGMMPNGTLGSKMFKKLKVYTGSDYKQTAQKPEVYKIVK